FTATVMANPPGSGTPTGTVTFTDGALTLGSGPLIGGIATFTTTFATPIPAGTNQTITAHYNGDTHFTAGTDGTTTETVNQDGTTTTVSTSQSPVNYGQAVTFRATVTP